MNLAVIGTGYVGLVTAAGFASKGHRVTCVDIDIAKVESLKRGHVPWHEPGLSELVLRCVGAGDLDFTSEVAEAASAAKLVFIAVGTPPRPDGSANTDAIFAAAKSLAKALKRPVPVVVRSTVPVGTARAVKSVLAATGRDCPVLSNPEFLREGIAVEDFLKPNRIVVGADVESDAAPLLELYKTVTTPDRIVVLDTRTAEMSKYACNTFLATKISFINQVADLCDAVGADVEGVRKVMGMDPRIGSGQLKPGLGYGGSCLPKDTQAVLDMGRKAGVQLPLVDAAATVNASRPKRMVAQLVEHFGGGLKGKRVAIWGLAFKPGTDDLREAPSLVLIPDLITRGAAVVGYDPIAMPATRAMLDGQIEYARSAVESATGADAVLLVTEWDEFKNCDLAQVRRAMRSPVFFDGRNVYDPRVMAGLGFHYYGVGRGTAFRQADSPGALALGGAASRG